jgi:hypothetical protein
MVGELITIVNIGAKHLNSDICPKRELKFQNNCFEVRRSIMSKNPPTPMITETSHSCNQVILIIFEIKEFVVPLGPFLPLVLYLNQLFIHFN